ncbi:MAG: minor capsid protein [Clostridium butyricum]|nr:minor capsid protein [Clostridium butyricum]
MKLNKNQELFAKIQDNFTVEIYRKYENKIKEIINNNANDEKKIMQEIANIILNYEVSKEVMKLSNIEKKQVKQKLNALIEATFMAQITFNKDFLENLLAEVIKDKINSNNFLINYALKPVKQNVINKILNEKINGKNYSDRIYSNGNKVAKRMKKEVDLFINGKTTVNEISNRISKEFNINKNLIKRLANNEIARTQNRADEIWRKEHNIKKVMYAATLDMKTCEHCAALDGKIYDNDKAPTIPRHIRCRCTLIAIVDENWRPQQRYSNKDRTNIDWKDYQTWLKEQQK